MDLRHLRTLVAISEHRTFAAAADAVGLTQSAVSLHVKSLEDSLRTTLFDRSTRPPTLTGAGQALVEKAREVVGLCDGMADGLAPGRTAGRLDMGAVPTVLTGILPTALVRLRDAHPDVSLSVTSGLSAELAGMVRKGGLDVAVVSEPTQLDEGLSWHPVGREPLMVIAPKGTRGKTDRALLEALPFIRFKRFAWAGRLIDGHLSDRGIRVRQSMELDSLEGVAAMVSHGLGVSVVPRGPIRGSLPDGIRVRPFGDPPAHCVIGLIERRANVKRDLTEALFAILGEIYSGAAKS